MGKIPVEEISEEKLLASTFFSSLAMNCRFPEQKK